MQAQPVCLSTAAACSMQHLNASAPGTPPVPAPMQPCCLLPRHQGHITTHLSSLPTHHATHCPAPAPAADIHLRPVAQQLNAVAFPGMKIWFCMQGEMNAAVMNYPRQFTQLVPYLKQTVTKVGAAAELGCTRQGCALLAWL